MSDHRAVAPLVPESVARLYRRAAQAWRSPAPAPSEAIAIARLSRVVELHLRVARVVEVAAELSEPNNRGPLLALSGHHARMAHAVGEILSELGGSAPRPEECALDLPRDLKALPYAHDQAALTCLVRDDLNYVAAAHRELADCEEIPAAMRVRLQAMSKGDRP